MEVAPRYKLLTLLTLLTRMRLPAYRNGRFKQVFVLFGAVFFIVTDTYEQSK